MTYNYEIGDKVIYHDKEFVIVSMMPDGSGVFIGGHWVDIKNIKPINKGEQMINKQEAKQQLEKLEAEVQKLKEIINTPEKAGSLLEDGNYYISTMEGRLCAYITYYKDKGVNYFSSKGIAQAYAEAFSTMLALRKCEGSVSSVDGEEQYYVSLNPASDGLQVYGRISNFTKLDSISPMFSTKEYAQTAIDKVGKKNIIKMFKTLHGIYD